MVLRPVSKNLYLRYTGFKGLILTSGPHYLTRPRIGYARLVIARNMRKQSQGMDINSVIYVGHKVKQPLIRWTSELTDGLEPHGLKLPVRTASMSVRTGSWRGGGVPGVGCWVGTGWVPGGCYTGPWIPVSQILVY